MKKKNWAYLLALLLFLILAWQLCLPSSGAGMIFTEAERLLPSRVVGSEAVSIDLSQIARGIISCRYSGESAGAVGIKSQGKAPYTVQLKTAREEEAFPLVDGAGVYTLYTYEKQGVFYVLQSVDEIEVQIEDHTLPFLQPNRAVTMKTGSETAALSTELAAGCETADAVLQSITDYLASAISYDLDVVEGRTAVDFPDPDLVLQTGRGVCLDYAVTAAAMLRFQNIPTKLLIGYMEEDRYHAWNEVYIDGWWRRVDVTLMEAGIGYGPLLDFVMDDSNYSIKLVY